jgi:predicted nucleic acid-binding protein
MNDAPEEALYLSVLTMGELEKGIARVSDARRKAKLTSWVRRELSLRFEGRVLAVDLPVAERWGTLVGESEAKGRPLPVIDSLLAATSLQHDLTVVTRNTADFEHCGARCFDPWVS